MPLFWNLDGIQRNQIIFCIVLVFFCPWPFLTLLFVFFLAFPTNEWEEERIGMTIEDYAEVYFHAFGFNGESLTEILTEQDKFFRIDIQGGLTDYEKKNAKKIVRETLQRIKGDEPISSFYEYWAEDFNELAKERYDMIIEILEMCKEDWDSMSQTVVPANDLMIESLDFWYVRLLKRESSPLSRELANPTRGRQLLFSRAKKVFFSKWYLRSHIDQWLYALPFQDKVFYRIYEDDLLLKGLKLKPLRQKVAIGNK